MSSAVKVLGLVFGIKHGRITDTDLGNVHKSLSGKRNMHVTK